MYRMISGEGNGRMIGAFGGDVFASLAERLPRRQRERLEIPGFKRAAVLVPLLDAPAGPQVLFTIRAAGLRSHAGQIAFPGGRLEPGEDSIAAALRETFEEVGLGLDPASVLGELGDHPSPFGFVATPVVARVPWPQALAPDPGEVAATFEVPLADLLAIEPTSEERQLLHYRRNLYSYRWHEHDIWGFTGNVVKELLDVLRGARDAQVSGDASAAGDAPVAGGPRAAADARDARDAESAP